MTFSPCSACCLAALLNAYSHLRRCTTTWTDPRTQVKRTDDEDEEGDADTAADADADLSMLSTGVVHRCEGRAPALVYWGRTVERAAFAALEKAARWYCRESSERRWARGSSRSHMRARRGVLVVVPHCAAHGWVDADTVQRGSESRREARASGQHRL